MTSVTSQNWTGYTASPSDVAAKSKEISSVRDDSLIDVMGPLVAFGAEPSDDGGFCVIKSIVPAGVVVPVHTHPDREVMFVLDGTLDALIGDKWESCGPGCTVDIPGDERHAFRNVSGGDVRLLLITTSKMGRFFKEIGQPASVDPRPPSPEMIQTFVATSQRYGYWLGSPEDNAAVGIALGS